MGDHSPLRAPAGESRVTQRQMGGATAWIARGNFSVNEFVGCRICRTVKTESPRWRRRQHALFSLMHGFVDLIEAFDGKKQVVDAIHLHRSVQNFIEAEIPHLA